jgi:hypothetical protein
MANLTDYLDPTMRGKETLPPYKPGPSIFEGLAQVASTVTQGLQGAADTRSKRAAAARQAEQDRLESSDRGAKNFSADAILDVGTIENQPIPAPAASGTAVGGAAAPRPLTQGEQQETSLAMDEGDRIGQQAKALQSGMKQGRLSAAQYELLLEAKMREGFAKFPDSKYVILDQIDKYGINHPAMSEYRAAKAAVEADATAQSGRENEAIRYSVENLGLPPDAPRESLVSAGFKGMADQHAVELARANYDFQRKVTVDNRTDAKAIDTAHDQAVGKWVQGALGTQFGAALDQFNTVIGDTSIPEKDRIKAAGEFINAFKTKAIIEQTILTAQSKYGMTAETGDATRKRLQAQVDEIFTQFSSDNPLNQIVLNGKILQTMKDRWQLDLTEAMPVYNQFKLAFGGSSDAVNTMVDTIVADPGLNSVFTRELKSFNGLSQGDQTIRLRNLMALMGDRNTSLRDYTPEQSAQIIQDSNMLFKRGFYRLALAGDSGAQRTVLNTLGKVANAATDLNPGSSTRSLVNATLYLANRDAYGVLRNLGPEHKEFGGIVADEMRVAVGKNLINLISQGTGDPYWKVAIDERNGKFSLKPTGEKLVTSSGGGGTGFMKAESMSTVTTPPPSKEIQDKLTAMNTAVGFLMQTSDFEDNSTLQRASTHEKFRFYTRGELPASAQPKPGQSGLERISRLQNFWANAKVDFKSIPQVDVQSEVDRTTGGRGSNGIGNVVFRDDGSRSATNLAGKEVKIPPLHEIAQQHKDNPIYNAVVNRAADTGMPGDIAVRLAFVENKFRNSGANSAGAYGPLQVVAKLHNDEALARYGKKVPDLSPEQNIDLGLWILAQNYKKRGNWLDAVHDYIGRGDNDGNMKSLDYAQLIAGGMDDGQPRETDASGNPKVSAYGPYVRY